MIGVDEIQWSHPDPSVLPTLVYSSMYVAIPLLTLMIGRKGVIKQPPP